METIRAYIEQMFASLPMTEGLMQLKQEILENMEDKYNELKNSGKNENEAVGTVISEFGNIDELLEELDLKKTNQSYNQEEKTASINHIKTRQLTEEEVYDYLLTSKVTRQMIAIGTALCILGVSIFIFIGGYLSGHGGRKYAINFTNFKFIGDIAGTLTIYGSILLLAILSIAVTLFILAGSKNEKYAFIEKENIELPIEIRSQIEHLFESRRNSIGVKNSVGVVLCIFSVIQLLLLTVFFHGNGLSAIMAVSIMLLIIAGAVYFFIIGNSEKGAYERILQKGEFALNNKNPYLETISTIYWCMITAVYLGVSFTTGKWGSSWIIWPVTGVLWAAIEAVFRFILGKAETK